MELFDKELEWKEIQKYLRIESIKLIYTSRMKIIIEWVFGDSNSIGHTMMKITRKYISWHTQKTNHVEILTILLSNGMGKGQREFNILNGTYSRNAEMRELNNFLNE